MPAPKASTEKKNPTPAKKARSKKAAAPPAPLNVFRTRGERNIAWIEEHLRIPEGKFVGQQVCLTPQQKSWIRTIYDTPTRTFILSLGRKNSKDLSLDTPIPTPGGWRTLGEIKPGDYVFGTQGQPVLVLHESEVFTGRPCFRVGFSDGSFVVASESHDWTTRHKYRPWEPPATYPNGKVRGSGRQCGCEVVDTITTRQIYESLRYPRPDGKFESNHKIDCAGALQTPDRQLPIPPYVLGAWLGNGTSANGNMTFGEVDLAHWIPQLETELSGAVRVARYGEKAPTVRTTGTGLRQLLKENDLLSNKHIPREYLEAGTQQRWALLQGLFDTDGTVSQNGDGIPRCSYCGINKELVYGVWRLARSLGLKAVMREGDAKIAGRFISKTFYVDFSADRSTPIFRLQRKQERLPVSLGKRSGSITITSCDPVASVPTKCIGVDSDDHLFLAGYGCIPTHNTATSAFFLLLHLCGPEARKNSQLYSAAQSREQASIIFGLAAKMVRMSVDLDSVVKIRDSGKQLFCPELGTLYRALSADASTAYGLSPVFTVHDELGQVKGPKSELYDALETASAAHESPLSIIISTQAPTDADLLSVLIDDALTGADPRIKCVLYTASLTIDPFSDEAIRQANPHFDIFMDKEEVRRQASTAKRMPSSEASYRNLILNQRVEARDPFVTRTVWEENGEQPFDIRGREVYGGLDLSSVHDLTALVLTTRDGDVVPTFWLPEEGLVEKSRVDRVPYDLWAKQGYLKTTPGRVISYQFVAEYLLRVFRQHVVLAMGFDRYNMQHLKPWLVQAGFTEAELSKFVEFGQGFASMSPAIRMLEEQLLGKRLRHGNHPVLAMCAHNAVVATDPAENRKFIKGKNTGRIDGIVALTMAQGVMPQVVAPQKKVYQMFFA